MVHEVSRQTRPSAELVALVVNSFLPLVGVITLGWNAAALLLLYWLEFGSGTFWALVRALFAGRPSELEFDSDHVVFNAIGEKRIPIGIPYSNLQIHPSSIPVVCIIGPILGVLWLLVGAVTVGTVTTGTVSSSAGATVMLCAVGIFVSHGIATGVSYIGDGEYREHSAQTVTMSVLKRLGLTLVIVLSMLPFASELFGNDIGLGTFLLAAIVVLKFGFDLASHYDERLAAFDRRNGGIFGWSTDPPEPESIEPLTTVTTWVRPTRWNLFLKGIVDASRIPVTPSILLFGFLFAAAFFFDGDRMVGVGLLLASVGLPVVISTVDNWIRYGWMEYQIDGKTIVGYDRLLGGPQWRVEAWDERGLRVETTWLDNRLGTETVVVELAKTEHRIPLLSEPDTVLDVFDRRPSRPSEE
jgi:hypothetical protein